MRSKDPALMERICAYLEEYYKKNRHVPTTREIASSMQISNSSAYRYLVAMDEKGIISYQDGKVVGSPRIDLWKSEYSPAPVVGSIRCGDPETEMECIEEYVTLPTSIFGQGEFYILHAEGTSMVDAGILPGDLVVIQKNCEARPGDIVVALDQEQQNTLKTFAGRDAETGKAVLLYQNKADYPNKRILVDELTVQGVANKVIHYL